MMQIFKISHNGKKLKAEDIRRAIEYYEYCDEDAGMVEVVEIKSSSHSLASLDKMATDNAVRLRQ